MKYILQKDTILREDGASIPIDERNRDYREYLEWVEAGNVAEEELRPEEARIGEMSTTVQRWMDRKVAEKGYSSILSACTYIESSVPEWAADAAACVRWRDAVWVKCFEIMEECKAGKRAIPTEKEMLEELPKLEW